jgi:hypothetical protein
MDIAFDEPTGTTDEGLGFVAASDTGFGMGFVESTEGFSMPQDEGLGGFGLSDEPAPEPAHEVYNPPAAESFSYSPPAPVEVAPAPVASMFAAPEAENPLTIWEAQHKIDLKEKAEREKVNNDKMRKDADAWLKQFSDERKKNHDLKHSDNQYVLLCPCDFFLLFSFFMLCFVNAVGEFQHICLASIPRFHTLSSRANEKAFKEEVEKIYKTGPTWTRVNSLVDMQQKTDRKDVGRMKVCVALLCRLYSFTFELRL